MVGAFGVDAVMLTAPLAGVRAFVDVEASLVIRRQPESVLAMAVIRADDVDAVLRAAANSAADSAAAVDRTFVQISARFPVALQNESRPAFAACRGASLVLMANVLTASVVIDAFVEVIARIPVGGQAVMISAGAVRPEIVDVDVANLLAPAVVDGALDVFARNAVGFELVSVVTKALRQIRRSIDGASLGAVEVAAGICPSATLAIPTQFEVVPARA